MSKEKFHQETSDHTATGKRPWTRRARRFLKRKGKWIALILVVLAGVAVVLSGQIDLGGLVGTVGDATPTPPSEPPALTTTPLMFIENVGQFHPAVKFQVKGGDRTIWLTEDAIWLTVWETPSLDNAASSAGDLGPQQGAHLKLSFPDANPNATIEAFHQIDTHVTYIRGNDPAQWYRDVPVWQAVRYVDIFPGADLEIKGQGAQWTWQVVARDPNFDFNQVNLQVEGADGVTLTPTSEETLGLGDRYLFVDTALGERAIPLLESNQQDVTPEITGEGEVVNQPFAAGATDDDQDAVPGSETANLLYSTFLVGNGNEQNHTVALNAAGNAYVAGVTGSPDFPTTPGAFDITPGSAFSNDAFVTELSADGSSLAFSTFIGGNQNDWAMGIALDDAGQVYVTGGTDSPDFPTTPGAFDTTCGNDGSCDPGAEGGSPRQDAFVAKLNDIGTTLIYATYVGGSDLESGIGIAVNGQGQASITGQTRSTDFPVTANAYDQTLNGADDIFVAQISEDGARINFASFLGGGDTDIVNDMALDSAGNLFLTGATYSMDFPATEGALNEIHRGGEAAFVAKVSSDGANLDYATFLTGAGDNGRSIAVDGEGNAYVAGTTFTEEFPVTPKAFDTTFDFEDIFVAKLNPTGSALKYATFLGGSSSEFGDVALTVDAEGFAYVTGSTNSSDFPITSGAYDADYNGGTSQGDAFIVRLNRSGTALSYASYLGGSMDDRGKGVVVDAAGYGYVIGDTESEDFPTTAGSFAPTTGDVATGLNAFVTKLAMPPSYAIVGQVEGTDGEPLIGVVVSDDTGRSATTDQHGYFVLSDLAPGTYTLDVQPGADYRPPEEKPIVQVPPDNDDVNIQLPLKPVSITLEPSTSSNLEYTTSEGEGLTLEFPANAVDTTTTLFLTPTVAHHGQGLVWAGCAFDLSAEQEGTAQASFQFNQPVAVTIAYQDSELGTFNDEAGLMLMQWTADGWQDVLDVCSSGGEYLRSSSENKVSVPICSTGRFALMSEVQQVYLPLLTKE